jgi:2-dehydro-3-deoxyphosphogluconate aldolase/(4S)-4-hydroxy-2-oxoglutarate aldolase
VRTVASKSFDDSVRDRIRECGVLAVVVVEKIQQVGPLMEALLRADVLGLELALRTPVALDALRVIKKQHPRMLAGIGTVITPEQVRALVGEGADFAVAPGTNRRVIEESLRLGLPFAPGISTASDIETALEYDLRLVKFFPAEPLGGVPYLKSLNGPYAHLGLEYIPLGGLNEKNMQDYLNLARVAAVGGSWIAKRELLASEDWETVFRSAEAARRLVKRLRPNG